MKNPPDPRATRTGGGVLRRVALCAHKPQDADADPHVATAGDSAVVTAWREGLGTDAAQALYTERAATAECVTAQARAASPAGGYAAPPACVACCCMPSLTT